MHHGGSGQPINILCEILNQCVLHDVKEYSVTKDMVKESMADADKIDLENIKRQFYGARGAGKERIPNLKGVCAKIKDNPRQCETLKQQDRDGSTYKAFLYAALGEDTDGKILKFQKPKRGEKRTKREEGKYWTKVKDADVKLAYDLRWDGYGWEFITSPKSGMRTIWKVTSKCIVLYKITRVTKQIFGL